MQNGRQRLCRPLQFSFQISAELSVSAAAETTAVESARAPAEPTAREASAGRAAANKSATPTKSGSSVEATSIEAATIEARTAVESTSPISMEPRAGADKDSADEPVRTVVAIRCAGIRGIPVVAIRACWGVTVAAANSNGKPNLRLRRNCRRKHANRQQNKVFEITHCPCPREIPG